jgi:pleiotropic regulator 1
MYDSCLRGFITARNGGKIFSSPTMNIQKPIGKPNQPVSLLAMRKSGTSSMIGKQIKPGQPQPNGAANQLAVVPAVQQLPSTGSQQQLGLMSNNSLIAALRKKSQVEKNAQWRAPWKLHRVIQGHLGWVRSVDVDPSNEWFASGATDRMIKIWDLATGVLRLTLTGHTHNVRAVRVHPHLKYLFSAGEDNMVKCWDLESNKVIRHYHGHVGGVYCLDVHPVDNVMFTGSRDTTVRMWDIRTRDCVHVLSGHTHTVQALACQSASPEVISGSTDATVRLWDIRAAGKAYKTLTHHQKGIRSISIYNDSTFATCSPDAVKVWKAPEGEFERNFTPSSSSNVVVNCSTVRDDGLFVTGLDNGKLALYDWDTGKQFQEIHTPPQPGSLDCENAIFDVKFDLSGTRIITAECDKTIKLYREDELAVKPGDED